MFTMIKFFIFPYNIKKKITYVQIYQNYASIFLINFLVFLSQFAVILCMALAGKR